MNALGTICLVGWLAGGLPAEESLLDHLSVALESPQRHLVVRCVDEAGKPVAGVTLNVMIDTSDTDYQSDAGGTIRVRLPEKDPPYLRLWTTAKGYVTLSASWRNRESKDPVPTEFTFPMRRGVSIGGVVRNEADEPIEGVKLELSLNLEERPQGRVRPPTYGYEVQTGAKGKWRLNDMPKRLARVAFRLTHPDYVSDSHYYQTPAPPVARLMDMTGVMVMKKGITVAGTITDPDGAAVAGATVAQGGDRFGRDYPKTTTDNNGRYRFSCNPGQIVLTVVAQGWAPDLRQFNVQAGLGPVDFQLRKGRTLRVRVVDEDGNRLSGVWVAPDTWRSHRTLHGLGVPRETNAQGLWVWDWAPDDAVVCDIVKRGYMSLRDQSLTARDEEYPVTLHRPFEVSGRVVDAESKEPIKAFRIVPGIDWDREGRSPSWIRYRAKDGRDGAYSHEFSEPYPKYLLRIEAVGYLPATSRSFLANERKATFDFELKKGGGPEGVVLDSEGKPTEGARVYVCSKSSRPHVRDGRNTQELYSVGTATDADGRFGLPPQLEPHSLLVLHDLGYAEVSQAAFAQSSEIRLVRWARVEGILRIGSGPGAAKELGMYIDRPREDDVPRAYFSFDATSDADGRFTFERVLPGKARVYRTIRFAVRDSGGSSSTGSHEIRVELLPGETARVELGGTGRPIEGRAILPPGEQESINWNFAYGRLSPNGAGLLRLLPGISKEQEERSTYAFNFQSDGTFRCDDVPGGTYELRVSVHDLPVPNR